MRATWRSVLIAAAVLGLGALLVSLALAPRVLAPGVATSPTQSVRASDGASTSPSPSPSAVPVATETTISSASAFSLCDVPGQGNVFTNTEVEPLVAVNPADRNNVIAVWQQDRSSGGGARAIVTAFSTDGGRTWRRTASPFGECATGVVTAGGYPRVSDPWVSCGPSGRCHQSALGVGSDGTSAVLSSYSDDGGRTWSAAQTLAESESQEGFNDKETITADPHDPNLVYAIWDRTISPGQAGNRRNGPDPPDRVLFARSTNGGLTWEAPRVIATAPGTPLGHQIVVLPDGTLVDVYEELFRRARPQQRALRSTDKGVTWSQPVTIATIRPAPIRSFATRRSVRTGEGLPAAAVDPRSGRVYVCWEDSSLNDGSHSDIVMSSSSDGGLTWSDRVRVNQTPGNAAAFTPSIAVAADGTIGVSYYDLRNETAAASLLADRFLVTSSDGQTWRETRLTDESFDVTKAPRAPDAYFLGDYAGLVAIANSFLSVFSVTTDAATDPTRMVAVFAP